MGHAFLDAVRSGKNNWWRYGLGIMLILFFAFILGAIPLIFGVAFVLADDNAATDVDPSTGMLVGVDPLLTFPLFMLSFVAALVGIVIALALIHRRPLRTAITPGRPVNWRRIAQGAGVWLALAAVTVLLEAALVPGRYQFTFDPARFFPFALVAICLVPIQSSAEELFFRGYLLQGLGLLTRNPLLLSVLIGLLFALPHSANPEVAVNFWAAMLFYFLFGAAMAFITLRDDSLELALGVHAGNNLFTSLLANFEGSAIETPALFTAVDFDPWYNLISGTFAIIAFYLLVFQPWRRTAAPESAET